MTKHSESLGDQWHCLLDDPGQIIPGMALVIAQEGGTREAWKRVTARHETVLLAFPPDVPIRGAVIVRGEPEGEMKAKSVLPLLEGLPNDMTIAEVYPWKSDVEGAVAARRNEDADPIWFYTPFLFRDRDDLTPGVRQTILLAGLAYGLRRALVDEMTITSGPSYEEYAALWLAENPGKTRLDVPQLKVPLAGARILESGSLLCEYQLRAPITSVETVNFGPETVYLLRLSFGLHTENPLELAIYASARICKNYVPRADDEIEAYVWLQGRMLDL
ncbi:MAG: hypothetical protein LBC10_05230 [Deltaproteobacteria bacterium]|jgi:hypothetical protein|nr:hypothetical protein [Deltaproteobacteria bacterium]